MGGFQCMAFYRRDGHVLESQLGDVTRDAETACSRHNFARHRTDYQTLVCKSSPVSYSELNSRALSESAEYLFKA